MTSLRRRPRRDGAGNCGLMILLVVLLYSDCGSGFIDHDIEMLPNDPIAEVGGRTQLTCTILPSYSGPYNSSFIYFKHNNRNYTSHDEPSDVNVTIVNRNVSVLILSNVTSDAFGHYVCTLPDLKSLKAGSQGLVVMRRPKQPVVTSCQMHNWEKFTCQWTPSIEEQKNHTLNQYSLKYKFSWRVDDDVWHNCSKSVGSVETLPTGSSCDIKVDEGTADVRGSFVSTKRVCVQVSAENSLKINVVSELWCSNVSDIVILDRPTSVRCYVNESHVAVYWQPPPSTSLKSLTVNDLDYKVLIKSKWMAQPTEVQRQGVTFYIQDSTIYTNYSLHVSVKPRNFGLWSDFSNCSITSPSAVPRISPPTTFTAFHAAIGAFPKKLTFYWKKIGQQNYNGPGFKYCLLKRSSAYRADWQLVKEVEASKSSCELLANERDIKHQFAVVSCNAKGQSSPTVIWKVNSGLTKAIKKFAFERNKMKVSVFWKIAADYTDVVDSLTVFWCSRGTGLCKDSVNWLNVSIRDRFAEVSLPVNYSSVMFGMASGSNEASSGISWADCIHDINMPPKPPAEVRASLPSYADHGEVLVEWSHSDCSPDSGFVKQFRLHYCQQDRHAQCSGDTETFVNFNGDYSRWNLTNLNHGATYIIWMTSIGSLGVESVVSNNVTATTTISWATSGAVTAVVVGLLIFLILSAFLVWRCCRLCNRYRRNFTEGLSINVPISSIKNPLPDEDNDNDTDYDHHPTRLLGGNRNSDHLTKPLMAPLSVTETPSPTCGCGQEDILWYVNSRHPASEDGDVSTTNDLQTYQTLNPSGTPSYNGMSTPPEAISSQMEDDRPVADSVPIVLQTVATVGSPADLSTACIGNTGYIVVGPETFSCLSIPNVSIPIVADNSNSDRLDLRDNGYSDLSLAVGQQLPDVCAVSVVLDTPKQQSRDSNPKWYDVSSGSSDTTVTDHSVAEPSEVLPLTQYAKIVGALERSTPPEDHSCMLDSYSSRQPVVADRINGMLTGPRCDANISFGNGAVSFHNGYVRHTDLYGPTAGVVDS